MAGRFTDKDHEKMADLLAKHAVQVANGEIPADSPPEFLKPADGLNAGGLQWWMPDHLTDEQRAQMKRFADAAAKEHDEDVAKGLIT